MRESSFQVFLGFLDFRVGYCTLFFCYFSIVGVRVARSGKNGEGVIVILGVGDGRRVLVGVREGVTVGELKTSGVGEATTGLATVESGSFVGVGVADNSTPIGGNGVGEITPEMD
jgi:hypothetical protein